MIFKSNLDYTRDTHPWTNDQGMRFAHRDDVIGWILWDPRREEFGEPPASGILMALRAGVPTSDIFGMLHILDSQWVSQFTWQERDHAVAVIERLIDLHSHAKETKAGPTPPSAAQQEADRRYPSDHIVEDPHGATGEAHSDPYGYDETANRAFVAGAQWQALRTDT